MNISRRGVTDHLISQLNTHTGKPVGDSEAPDGGGWQGEINNSTFVPYTVLYPRGSNSMENALAHGNGDTATLVYVINSIGVSREQAEWMSDLAMDVLTDITRVVVDDTKILLVEVTNFGGVDRSDNTDPPFFSIVDTVEVYVTPA